MEAETKTKMDEILSHYSGRQEELISILQEAQGEFRYLPSEVMQEVARFLKLPESTVFGVSTFYAQFRLNPVGKKILGVCKGPACHLCGEARLRHEVERQLDIKPGETTEDFEYTLETVACSGSCALAPVMVVDQDVYGRMTTAKVGEVLTETG